MCVNQPFQRFQGCVCLASQHLKGALELRIGLDTRGLGPPNKCDPPLYSAEDMAPVDRDTASMYGTCVLYLFST